MLFIFKTIIFVYANYETHKCRKVGVVQRNGWTFWFWKADAMFVFMSVTQKYVISNKKNVFFADLMKCHDTII